MVPPSAFESLHQRTSARNIYVSSLPHKCIRKYVCRSDNRDSDLRQHMEKRKSNNCKTTNLVVFSEYTQEASCSRHHWEASWEHREASTSRDISEASLRPLELSGRHLEASRGICEASGDTRLHVKDNNLGMREPSGGIWGHPAIFGNISRHLSLSRSLEAGQGI